MPGGGRLSDRGERPDARPFHSFESVRSRPPPLEVQPPRIARSEQPHPRRRWAVTEEPPLIYPLPTRHLRDAAMRLAGELDEVRLYNAAAHVSMAVDAIDEGPAAPLGEAEMRTDVELEFELDEHGRVWMIREGDCHIIGRTNAVCAEMRRFLASVVLGDPR
jgi:hypothetical protein